MNAQEIIDSKVFSDAFESMEADLWVKFRRAEPTDADELRGISLRLWALDEVRAELERRMTKSVETRINGKV